MNMHLLKGDELFDTRRGESTYIVMETELVDGHMKVFDKTKNDDCYVRYEQLRMDIGNGHIRINRPNSPPVSGIHQRDKTLDKELIAAQEIAREVRTRANSRKISLCQAYGEVREIRYTSDPTQKVPARATVYRYLRRDREGLPVLSGNQNKGNRSPRRTPQVIAIIEQELKARHQQVKSKWSIADVTEKVNIIVHDERLLPRYENVSRKYVSHILWQKVARDPETARMDPRTVAAGKAVAKHKIRVHAPLMRVEQDALHVPWCVTTPYGKTNKVYLVHAIDCFTGMPVGWALVIGAPTVSDTLRCVESILFSKKERLAQLGVQTDLDPYGTPSLLVLDNGGENKGDRIQRLVHLGIDPKHCRSRHPQEKPFIERLNKSLKEALEVLPGCTRFDGEDGKRDPELLGDANMTLQELEHWIVSWYYEKWAHHVLERHVHSVFTDIVSCGNTPASRWKSMVEEHGFALPLPPSISQWRMTLFDRAERTLSRKTGITYSGFHFRGANLQYLISKYGEELVIVYADPDDFRHVFVQDGLDGELVELINDAVNEVTPAYSYGAGKDLVKERKASDRGNEEASKSFDRRKFARDSQPGKADKKSSKPEESRETTKAAKHHSAVNRAAENPLPPVLPAAESDVPFIAFDDAPALPVLNRNTGKQQEQ